MIERQDAIVLLAVGAFALLLAACEGGAPTSVSLCDKLDKPTLTSPANGVSMPRQPTLKWENVEDNIGYTLKIFLGSSCSGTVAYENDSLSASATSHIVNQMLTGLTTYAWYVIAVGDCESGTGFSTSLPSECRFFTTSQL